MLVRQVLGARKSAELCTCRCTQASHLQNGRTPKTDAHHGACNAILDLSWKVNHQREMQLQLAWSGERWKLITPRASSESCSSLLYPNLRRTAQVVSSLPRSMNSACRKRKPGSVSPLLLTPCRSTYRTYLKRVNQKP